MTWKVRRAAVRSSTRLIWSMRDPPSAWPVIIRNVFAEISTSVMPSTARCWHGKQACPARFAAKDGAAGPQLTPCLAEICFVTNSLSAIERDHPSCRCHASGNALRRISPSSLLHFRDRQAVVCDEHQSLRQIEAIQIHHLVPRGDKIVDEFFPGIRAAIDFRHGAKP